MEMPIFNGTNAYSIYDKNSSILTISNNSTQTNIDENEIMHPQDFIINSKYHYLSMIVFDDENECYSYCNKYFNYDNLRQHVCDCLGILLNDPNLHFDMSVGFILSQLLEYYHCVFNRHQKYYIIAIAIDFEPFQIWSKDCDAQIIKWSPIDEQSQLIIDYKLNNKVIKPPPKDYDVNPVIKYMENLKVR